MPGIDLDTEKQIALLVELSRYSAELDWPETPSPDRRYCSGAGVYGIGSAFFLFAMMKKYRPARIVEVGSGFSSALMLDTVDHNEEVRTSLTFIEPEPTRLRKLLRETSCSSPPRMW